MFQLLHVQRARLLTTVHVYYLCFGVFAVIRAGVYCCVFNFCVSASLLCSLLCSVFLFNWRVGSLGMAQLLLFAVLSILGGGGDSGEDSLLLPFSHFESQWLAQTGNRRWLSFSFLLVWASA